jgi:hypothetical protein
MAKVVRLLHVEMYTASESSSSSCIAFKSNKAFFIEKILKLFTGMAPTHDMFRDGLTLQKHVEKNAFRGMLMQIIDPVLLSIEETMAEAAQWDM